MNAIPYALLTLGAIFGFVVSWALNQFWKFTIGFMFEKLAKIGIPTGFFGKIEPFKFLEGINNSVHDFLSGIAAASEHAMTRLFTQTITAFRGLASEIGSLAEAVEQRLVSLAAGTVPRLIRSALGGIWGQIKRIPGIIKRVEGLAKSVARSIAHAAQFAANGVLKAAKKLIRSVEHLATRAWKLAGSLKHRIGALERKLIGKRLAALINKALGALLLPWLFADNVIALAKTVVSWSSTLARAVKRYISKVDDPVSLVELTNASAVVVQELEKQMRWFIKEYHADRIAPGSTIGDIEV